MEFKYNIGDMLRPIGSPVLKFHVLERHAIEGPQKTVSLYAGRIHCNVDNGHERAVIVGRVLETFAEIELEPWQEPV